MKINWNLLIISVGKRLKRQREEDREIYGTGKKVRVKDEERDCR